VYVERVSVTEKAKAVIDQLREQHGELMFHQSGGCCDGSSPMCFAKGDFMVGSRDLCLGEIHGCNFYMAADQFEFYKNSHITVDVSPGRELAYHGRCFTWQRLELLVGNPAGLAVHGRFKDF